MNDQSASLRADSWFARGLAYYDQRRWVEAISSFDQALAENDQLTRAWALRGAAHFGAGEYGAALSDTAHALANLRNTPAGDPKLFIRVLPLHAEILFRLGRFSDALRSFSELQEQQTLTAYQWAMLANTHRSLHHAHDAVVGYHQALIHPQRAQLSNAAGISSADWFNVALFCFEQKAYDDALEASRIVVSGDPNNVAGWGIQAQALLALERYEEALASAKRALELNDRYAPGWLTQARAHRALKRWNAAHDAYERVLVLLPVDHPEWQTFVGEDAKSLLQGGHVKEALEVMAKQARRKISKPQP